MDEARHPSERPQEDLLAVGRQQALELAVQGAPLDEILRVLVGTAQQQVGDGARAAIFSSNRDGARFRLGAAAGMSEACCRAVTDIEIGPHRPSGGTAASTGETVIVPDIEEDPLWASALDLAREHDIRACWSHPFSASGVIGAIVLYLRKPCEPGPDELEAIGALAATAALVIDRYEQDRDAEEHRDQSARLHDEQRQLLEMIASGRPLEHCLAALCEALPRLSTGTRACVLLADDDRLRIRDSIAPAIEPSFGMGLKDVPINELATGICGEEVFRGKSVASADIANDETWSEAWREFCNASGIRACHCEPVQGATGEPIGAFMLCFDRPRTPSDWEHRLTEFGVHIASMALERDRSRRALQESEERYRALVTASSDVVYRMSPDWREMRQLHGRQFIADMEEPSRDWLEGYIPPDDQPQVLSAINDAVRTKGMFELEHRVRRVDGSLGWTFSRAIPVLDEHGEIAEWFGTASDVTRRKESEEALSRTRAESERQRRLYEAIISSTPDLVYVFDLDYRFTFANDALLEMWGQSRNESIGKRLLELGYEPWHAEMHEREIDEIIATKQPVRGEVAFPHATFGRRIYDYILVPVLNANDQVEAIAGTTRDITERKTAEQAVHEAQQRLQEVNRSLEQRVSERTVELERQTEQLRNLAVELTTAEHRERKRLAAMLHDDLQQSVVAAKMSLGLSRDHVQDDAGVEAIAGAERFLDEIMESSRNLTRQLRPPALYEDGLVSALRGLASDLEERLRLHVQIEADAETPSLGDDPDALLFDCARELLINAAKHAAADRATVEVHHQGEQLRLIVRDEGRGFDLEVVEEGDYGVEGFGLFSIRERLTALGGDFGIDSAAGRGTRIELVVPVTRGKEEADFPVAPASEGDIGRMDTDSQRTHIVVIDDHAIVRQGIVHILNGHERLVVTGEAADGFEAIETLQQKKPDVALVDVNMPRMNGVEVTREIHRRWPHVVTVGLSVNDDESTAELMREAGAAAFVPKSGSAEQIISTILDVAPRRRGRTIDG